MGISKEHKFSSEIRNARLLQQAFNPIRTPRGKIRGVCYDPVFPDMVADQADHVLDRDFAYLADSLGVSINGIENIAFLNSWTNWAFGEIAKCLKSDAEKRVFYMWKCSLIFANGDCRKGVKKFRHSRGENSDTLRKHTKITRYHKSARKNRENADDSERYSAALSREIKTNIVRQSAVKSAGKARKKGKADLDAMRIRFAKFAAKNS